MHGLKFLVLLLLGYLTVAGCLDPSAPGNLVPRTVDDDPSLPRAELNGTVFHLETRGEPSSQPVVVLHGGPGHDYRCMLSLVDDHGGGSLADDYYFIFWDQRGSGLSRRHSDGSLFSFENYLRDLEAVVDAYAGDRSVVLLGHSWGGGYAALFMSAHPEQVSGAILIEPMPLSTELEKEQKVFEDSIFEEWAQDWVWLRGLIGQNSHAEADYFMSMTLTENIMRYRADSPHPFWREGAATHLFMDPLFYDKNYDFTVNLEQIVPEVLFVAAENTKDLGAEFQDIQRRVFPNSRLAVVSDAGHYDLVWRNADQTVGLIRTYLESLELDGGNK